MARRYRPFTDDELLNLLNQSDDEDIIMPNPADYGWTDNDGDEPAGESVATNVQNIPDPANAEPAYADPDFDVTVDSSSDSEEEPESKPEKSAKRNKTVDFRWKDSDLDPKVYNFNNSGSGCKIVNLDDSSTVYDCFQVFFSQEIVNYIAEQCNLYYDQLCKNASEKSRLRRWKNTDTDEIYCFLAVNFLMAQVRKNEINSYWTNDVLLSTPMFAQIMPRDRYLLLLRMLHFVDNCENPGDDKLWKIRRIVDHLRKVFPDAFYPFKNLCIDESLVLYKGRVFFKQYIPSKRHRFGIKFFVLCDCETGYILDFIIYVGEATDIKKETDFGVNVGIPGRVVLTLLERYLGKGHTLYVDNWYTSPTLFSYLYDRETNACGTVRINRKGMPALSKKLKKGEIEFMSTDKLLALKWQDKREVRMLSTLHTSEIVATDKIDRSTNEAKRKPACIVSYTENMGAVDRSDMMLSSVECVRKTVKWYKKVFFHLVDLSLLNAYALYKTQTGRNISVSDFQQRLIKEIIEIHHRPQTEGRRGRRSTDGDNPLRLIERHFISLIPGTSKKKNAQRRCIVCAKHDKRSDTRYMCIKCNVPLCLNFCFERYHTLKFY